MAELIAPQRGAYERLGPTDTGEQAATSVAVTTSPQNFDLDGTWGGVSERVKIGGAYFSFQAIGASGDRLSIRFKSTSSVASMTVNQGCSVYAGTTEEFWVPSNCNVLEVIGSAAITLVLWMSSRNYGK